MRSDSTLARWLTQVRRSFGSAAATARVQARRERAVRRLRAQETAADPWLAEERVLLSAPVVMLSVASATYTENASAITLVPTVTASDPDADLIIGAQVRIVDFESTQDQLSFTPQFGINGSYNNMTGILTLNGISTASRYATVLSSVKYVNLTDAPSDLTRTIEYRITDTEPATSAAATLTLNLISIADTPDDVNAVADEDTFELITLEPNPIDGNTVTHFQITGITNGTLFLNDETTMVNDGDFITATEASTLKFKGDPDYFGPAEFKFQAAVGNTLADLGGDIATASITVEPVADTPDNVTVIFDEDMQSGPIELKPNPVDGLGVTHFQITGITNGTLYLNDGMTVVNNNDFITVTEASSLIFKSNPDYFGPAQFKFQAALGNTLADRGGALATASITVRPIADTPDNVMVTVDEDTLSDPIVLKPNPVDGLSVTHFQITGITNGTLFLNNGMTVVNNGDFITLAQATAGLRYQGNLNYFGPAQFQFQAAVGNTLADRGGGIATASITVVSVNDPPTITVPKALNTNEGFFQPITGIVIDDVDVAGNLMTVKFQATGPTASYLLGTTTGITFLNGTTNGGSMPLEISGTLANLQAALASLRVQPHDNGLLELTIVITDELNASAQDTIEITVANVNPSLDLTMTMPAGGIVYEGDFVKVTGTASDPANSPNTPTNNDPLTFIWSVTKNNVAYASGMGNVAEFQVNDNAKYVVTMTVADDDGGSTTRTLTFDALNVAPTPTVTGATTGFEGTAINLAATSTDPANMPTTPTNNDSVTYAWQVLRNGAFYTTGAGTNFTLTPNNEGTYEVYLTASDEDGGSRTTLHTITVANVAPTAAINATNINGQFYTYVDIAVDDPGNDGISILIVWGDINPNDFLNDPFLAGETATTRGFPTVAHRYLNAPNPQDPLAPVTITFFINDGTTTVIQQVTVEVTEQGIPAGGVYITPEPEQIVLPPEPVSILPPQIISQPQQLQVRNEEIVSREDQLTDEDARLVLHVVGPTGVEGPAVTLPEGLLQNLRGLFAKLPDGHYRVYLVQGESRRLVIEAFVRQGRAIDPAEADQGTQERPPQVQPAAQQEPAEAEPERVMQAAPVGQAVPDLELAAVRTVDASTSMDPDANARIPAFFAEESLPVRQAPPDLPNADSASEMPENADQTSVLSLAAAGVVAGTSWRRAARRQRAAASTAGAKNGTTGSDSGEKIEKTWSRLARRARQWKPR